MSLRTAIELLRNPVLRGTLVIQGLGSLATLSLGLLIAWSQGPQAQGHYGVVRASADLLLALALLGLPQGVVHVVNHRRGEPAALAAGLRGYVAALAGLGLLLALVFDFGIGPGWLPADLHAPAATLALGIGVLGWVVHGLQRSFVLCLGSTERFSWLTAAPALSLFAAVGVLLATGSQRYEWALAASGVASAAWGAWAMSAVRAAPAWRQGGPVAWRDLLGSGGHSTVQTVALALQPWLALWLLRHLGATPRELGWFVLAGYVQQLFALPANFVMPLLLARASKAAGSGEVYDVSRSMRAVVLLTLAGAAAAALVLPLAVPWGLGLDYRPAVAACVCMALGGPAVMLGRLLSALMTGRGQFRAVTLLFVLRVVLMAAATLVLARAGLPGGRVLDPVTAAAAAWALAETVVALAMLAASRRHPRPVAAPERF